MEIENLNKDKKMQKIKIVLIIIGLVLIFSALRGVYYTYKQDKDYKLKGWQTALATCTEENSYTRTR